MKKHSQKSGAPRAVYAGDQRILVTSEVADQVDRISNGTSSISVGYTTVNSTKSDGKDSSSSTESWECIWQKRAGRSKQTESSHVRGRCVDCDRILYDGDVYYQTHTGILICWECSPNYPMD